MAVHATWPDARTHPTGNLKLHNGMGQPVELEGSVKKCILDSKSVPCYGFTIAFASKAAMLTPRMPWPSGLILAGVRVGQRSREDEGHAAAYGSPVVN